MVSIFLAVQSPWLLRNRLTHMDPAQGNLLAWSIHHGSYPDFMYEGRPETLGWPFRYDPSSAQYIFNLSTKTLSAGDYELRINLGDGVVHTVKISLKK